jgi:hypothetical protein
MSRRHQASRRRVYGRRQHELHERGDRRAERGRPEQERIEPGGEGWELSYLDDASRARDAA